MSQVLPSNTVGYVYPSVGSDSTGDGTPESPYATLQKAYEEGKRVIYLGAGNVGPMTLTSDTDMVLHGLGHSISKVQQIFSNGYELKLKDGAFESFEILADFVSCSLANGGAGGNLHIEGVYAPEARATSTGNNGNAIGVAGGNGGNVKARKCVLSAVDANGGTGGPGEGDVTSGNGGSAGIIDVEDCKILNHVDGIKGLAGSSNDEGPIGTDGSDGSLNAKFSDIGSIGTFSSQSTVACIVSGAFVP